MDIRRGDTVVLLKIIEGATKGPKKTGGAAGKENRGKTHRGRPLAEAEQGKVLKVLTDTQRVVVEGVHFVWKHQRPTQAAPKGAKIQKEAPIHVSNVQLVCPACGKPTRIAHRREGDRNVRACKKCKAVIQTGKA